jgi:DNA invertase Pin-like site-specific DNA recombinase
MRRLLCHRIRPFTSVSSQHLNRLISGLPIYAPIRLADRTQSDVWEYLTDDNCQTDQPTQGGAAPEEGSDDESQSQDESDDDEQSSGADDEDDRPIGLIYARVSSTGQLSDDEDDNSDGPDEGSIEGQIEELEKLANKEGIALPYEPITDEAETGTDFDRDGIRKVFNICRREAVDYLLTEKIDRIGRNAPETIYFIYLLQMECDVVLLTPSGERDVDQIEGLLQTTLLSLMSEIQNDIRTTKAKKERIRGFLEKKNWRCLSPKVPLGYSETDDGWLKVNPDEKEIVREMFRKFLECEEYAATRKHIESEFGKAAIEGHRVKTLLTNSVYIGEPKVPDEWLIDTPFENDLHEPELNILEPDKESDVDLDKDAFSQTQAIIEEKNERSSTDDDTYGLIDFINEYSLFAVVEGSERARLVHSCGEPMVKNGQRTIGGRIDKKTHEYYCPECDEKEDPEDCYRKWPTTAEYDAIQLIQKVLNGEFSVTDLFD